MPECRRHHAWQSAFVNAIPLTNKSDQNTWFPQTDLQVYLDEQSSVSLRELIPEVSGKDFKPGTQLQPTVDATTGALEMNLTRLFVFEKQPKEWPGRFHPYHVYDPSRPFEKVKPLCLSTWTSLRTRPGDQLFAFTTENELDAREGYNTMYLILRPTRVGEAGVPTFKLVTTRIGLCSVRAWKEKLRQGVESPESLTEQDWPRLRNLGFLRLHHTQASVASAVNNVIRVLVEARNLVITPQQTLFSDYLPSGADKKSRIKASKICIAFLKHGARSHVQFLRGIEAYFRHDRNAQPPKAELPIAQSLREFLVRNGFESLLVALRGAYDPPLTLLEMSDLIRRGPSEAHSHISIPKYISGFSVDGSIHRVRIV